jgi:hypothetical protein
MVLLVLVVAIAAGVGGYNWGLSEGLEEAARSGGEVVRVYGHHGGGFFPFGIILFPLFIFGIFALMRAAFWGGRWGGPGHHQGGHYADDWHRRQHEEEGRTQTPGETGTA